MVTVEDIDHHAGDLRIGNDLNRILGETGWFDCYFGIGAGHEHANNQGQETCYTLVGCRIYYTTIVSNGKLA